MSRTPFVKPIPEAEDYRKAVDEYLKAVHEHNFVPDYEAAMAHIDAQAEYHAIIRRNAAARPQP